jgi:hypothetical protein
MFMIFGLTRRGPTRVVFLSGLLCSAALSWAGKDFIMPAARPATSYPAHDEHSDEAVAVGLDPYDMADKAKIFSIHYSELGFVPIFVVVTNNGGQPISLREVKIQLITADRTKISPAAEDDIYRRISRPSAHTSSPLPFPKKVKGGVGKGQQEEIRNSRFAAEAVEPHSSQSGFLFFDVSGISSPLAGARFYLTGARDAKGNELMYFEVPLEKSLTAPADASAK